MGSPTAIVLNQSHVDALYMHDLIKFSSSGEIPDRSIGGCAIVIRGHHLPEIVRVIAHGPWIIACRYLVVRNQGRGRVGGVKVDVICHSITGVGVSSCPAQISIDGDAGSAVTRRWAARGVGRIVL